MTKAVQKYGAYPLTILNKYFNPAVNSFSFEKIRPWFFIRLRDRRSKSLGERKVSKTFRFKPETIDILKNLKDQTGQSETAILENLIATKGC